MSVDCPATAGLLALAKSFAGKHDNAIAHVAKWLAPIGCALHLDTSTKPLPKYEILKVSQAGLLDSCVIFSADRPLALSPWQPDPPCGSKPEIVEDLLRKFEWISMTATLDAWALALAEVVAALEETGAISDDLGPEPFVASA